MLAITAGVHVDQEHAPPSDPYLRATTAGLREAHGWLSARIGAYLARPLVAQRTSPTVSVFQIGG
jgi:hypothetical protein